MQVFINEQEIGALSVDGTTVGEVVAALAVHVPLDHVVTEVDLDGECFRGDADDGYARRPSRGVARLSLRTRGPDALVAELRDEVFGALAIVSAKLDRVIELFAERDPRSAQELLAQLAEELHLAIVLEGRVASLAGEAPRLPVHEFERVAARLVDAHERSASAETAELLASELRPLLAAATAALAEDSSRK